MSKDKEIINKLVKVVAQQQQIITKLAQALPPAHDPKGGDLRSSVQADIIDFLYGKGVKLIPGKVYAQVHYAKVQPGQAGNALVVGLTVPASAQEKWGQLKGSVESVLKQKYSGITGQPISSIVWRE